jgi:hypothetical protein
LLLEKLAEATEPGIRESRLWPQGSQEVGKQLRRLASPLRAVGIEVELRREGREGRRVIVLRNLGQDAVCTVRVVRRMFQDTDPVLAQPVDSDGNHLDPEKCPQ